MNLRNAVRKAYKQTEAFKVAKLKAELSRWQRKETLARNKATKIRAQLLAIAETLAAEKAGITETH